MEFKNVFDFAKTDSFIRDFLSFLVPVFIIIFLPGPTYIAGFIFVYTALLFYLRRDLPVVFFQIYLLTLVYGEALLTLKGALVQDFVYYKLPVLLSVPIRIPLRFIIFCFFALSIIRINKDKSADKALSIISLIPLVLSEIIILLISFGQIFGDYPLRYNFVFLQVLQIFMVFPVVFYFLRSKIISKFDADKIKRLFMSFAAFSLSFEGIIAIAQYAVKSSLGINIETPFDFNFVSAPETGNFRSPGTLSHPNYLGVFIGMLLPLVLSQVLHGKSQNVAEKKIYMASLIFGFAGLFLCYSRWAWISFMIGFIIFAAAKRDEFGKVIRSFTGKFYVKFFVGIILTGIAISVLLRFSKFETLKSRTEIFRVAVSQIRENPVWGVGPGNSTVNLLPYRESINEYLQSLKGVHNTLLLIGVEAGMPALLIFLMFVAYITLLTIKLSVKKSDLFVYAVVLLVFIINSVAYPLYIWDSSFELFFLVCAFYIYLLDHRLLK